MKKADVVKATGICNVLSDVWFAVDPETGDLLFWQSESKRKGKLHGASPQCHTSQATAEHLYEKLHPWASITFFERVVYPIDVGDYQR